MSIKADHKPRRPTMVPVTIMEQIPVLTGERATLLTSLEEAKGQVEAGEAIGYDPKSFRDRLLGIYRDGRS